MEGLPVTFGSKVPELTLKVGYRHPSDIAARVALRARVALPARVVLPARQLASCLVQAVDRHVYTVGIEAQQTRDPGRLGNRRLISPHDVVVDLVTKLH